MSSTLPNATLEETQKSLGSDKRLNQRQCRIESAFGSMKDYRGITKLYERHEVIFLAARVLFWT